MRTILLLLAVACVALAQVNNAQWIAHNDPRCDGANWNRVDRTSSYFANFTGMTKACVRDYVSVCTGPQGIEICNDAYAECREVHYDWQDADLYPEVRTNVKPAVCVSNGSVMSADAKVVAIAQVILGFFVFLGGFGFTIGFAKDIQGGGVALVAVALQLLMSILLMFSFFYLNGIVQFAASIAGLAMFRPRAPLMTGLGVLLLMSAFFWTTYDAGLGGMQVNARFFADKADTNYFQDICNSYYRGYFTFVSALRTIGENPERGPWGYCDRKWIACVIFFQQFAQLLLVLQAVGGIHALYSEAPKQEDEVKEVSETEPAQ